MAGALTVTIKVTAIEAATVARVLGEARGSFDDLSASESAILDRVAEVFRFAGTRGVDADDADARAARADEARAAAVRATPKHVYRFESYGHVRYACGTGTSAARRTLCGAPMPPDGANQSIAYSFAKGLSDEGRRAWTLCPACVAKMGKPGKAAK